MGAILVADGKWHRVISDPRKNMLLDIKSHSKEDAVKEYKVELKEQTIEMGNLGEKSSVFRIAQYKDYSDAEEQFLIPSSENLHVRNLSSKID